MSDYSQSRNYRTYRHSRRLLGTRRLSENRRLIETRRLFGDLRYIHSPPTNANFYVDKCRDIKVSRPLFGLGLTVIAICLGLGLMKYWSVVSVSDVLVSRSQSDHRQRSSATRL